MPKSNEKQLMQVHNILQTLLEASEHFHKLIKAKEVNQSIFIFSSIVEGLGALGNVPEGLDKQDWSSHKGKVEQYLLQIAKLLEQGQFLKISEILQFSFIPFLKKMLKQTEAVTQQSENKTYTIGVFSPQRNPRDFYTKERLEAMLNESEKQDTKLIFFTSKDVDLEHKTISADVFTKGEWQQVKASYPDVINNVGGGRRTRVDRRLRREVPFTSFFVGNKFFLPKRMVQYRKYAELLVPFKLCLHEIDIHDFLEENNSVVFKALSSNRGENIYFVTKKGSRYTILAHKKEHILSEDAFNKWVQNTILKEKGSFIVQRYIHTRTKADEPYHIRAHVQKNGDGEWVLTHIYPRVGNKKSNLSNVATDGRVEDLHDFMQQEYGDKGEMYEQDILRLSMELAHYLDKLHNLALDELGIDLAIDENGRYWMHEANNGPQTAYHEEKRAVNTIAYAKYIAKNGIYHSDFLGQTTGGRFQARTSQLPFADTGKQAVIGILMGRIADDNLSVAIAKSALNLGISLFAFTPKDLDMDEMLIKGHFYEDGKWVPKIVAYPDVVIDRLKLRGDHNAEWVYEELEDIQFTNEWPGRRYSRSQILDKLQTSGLLTDVLPSSHQVTKPRDIFRELEKHGKVLLVPETGPLSNGSTINQTEDGKYQMNSDKAYSELPLRNKLKDILEREKMIVFGDQRKKFNEDETFTICTNLIRVDDGWESVNEYADIKSLETGGSFREDLQECLIKHFGEAAATEIMSEAKHLAVNVADALKYAFGDLISEVSIVMGVVENYGLHLIDVNPNGPEHVYDAEVVAEKMVESASRCLKQRV
ncbi:UDP-N-acetylmuramoyl-tripeptide--D-alanyl-D-alanine ligase [Lentibacillus sp. JNUCC-1]|uniref:YheC/YheD family protein n=1 Tax=Lentibacillus sp. JNUCC-1 TaxID=2654513 RepID=UPI0012E80B04|nr:YheC/YheD family protein [Lentibacillus sp. JNUCC-1]MUV37067.1 UDP-N-acetylmuramoyl-tripeptide--D-alanyl-D-alanine ligase [Lentibacillus sp. JNUCC-1]